jgi:hypothetical protein
LSAFNIQPDGSWLNAGETFVSALTANASGVGGRRWIIHLHAVIDRYSAEHDVAPKRSF